MIIRWCLLTTNMKSRKANAPCLKFVFRDFRTGEKLVRFGNRCKKEIANLERMSKTGDAKWFFLWFFLFYGFVWEPSSLFKVSETNEWATYIYVLPFQFKINTENNLSSYQLSKDLVKSARFSSWNKFFYFSR